MQPLYSDLTRTREQQARVLTWVKTTGFAAPGASPDDFEVVARARYVGFMFTHEDLETFVVGLRCTKPGLTQVKTAIQDEPRATHR